MTVKTVKTPLLSTGRGNNLIEIKQPRRSRNSRGAFLDYRQMGPQQQHQQRPFQTQPQRQLRQRRIEYPPFPSDVLCESCRIIIVRPGALRRSCVRHCFIAVSSPTAVACGQSFPAILVSSSLTLLPMFPLFRPKPLPDLPQRLPR